MQILAALSDNIALLAATAAPWVCAIRTGANQHVAGLLCQGNLIVTIEQTLPAFDTYTIILSGPTAVQARLSDRDPASNIAILRLERPQAGTNPDIAEAAVGGLAVLVGADQDAAPTARLAMVHRLMKTAGGAVPVLDLPADTLHPGSLVLNAHGRLLGLAAAGPNGEAVVVPSVVLSRKLLASRTNVAADPNARGWLGVSLQPITLPDAFVGRAGQPSGRMVVHVTPGGPAELAGLQVGDVLLSLNDTNASGPNAMRAFLGSDRIGTVVRVKLLRDGVLMTASPTVAAQPR